MVQCRGLAEVVDGEASAVEVVAVGAGVLVVAGDELAPAAPEGFGAGLPATTVEVGLEAVPFPLGAVPVPFSG